MTYDPARHHRRSIRLKEYDYTQAGAYFVTLCVQDEAFRLGEIASGALQLTDEGQIVEACWLGLASRYDHVELDAWVVMPNNLHGIIVLTHGDDEAGGSRTAPTAIGMAPAPGAPKRKPLGRLIGAFKTVSTKRINSLRGTPGARLWQRDFYERIIRGETEWDRIRRYIADNPRRWASGRDYDG